MTRYLKAHQSSDSLFNARMNCADAVTRFAIVKGNTLLRHHKETVYYFRFDVVLLTQFNVLAYLYRKARKHFGATKEEQETEPLNLLTKKKP